jgi:plastocyanin domain-containing protein
MDINPAIAIAAGLAALAWINWYFFLAQRTSVIVAATGGGVQEVQVRVLGGYEPAQVRVRAGAPVRLVFDRQEDSSCSEELVIPDFGIRRFLPAFSRTAVEFTPTEPGSHEFTCGMGMLRGRVTVEAGGD